MKHLDRLRLMERKVLLLFKIGAKGGDANTYYAAGAIERERRSPC
jgi:hypothetical protein